MDFIFPMVNLRSLFFFTSGFMEFGFLLFIIHWLIKLIKKDDR